MTLLEIEAIRTNGGTQPRAQLDWIVISEYADAMRDGAAFPPVLVFYDGVDYWLVDGFHRLLARKQAGQTEIDTEVRPGTLQDAQWHSYSVNQAHGLRRTNDDKRRAVEAALAHPFAGSRSGEEIARHCGVSNQTVSNYRKSISQNLRDTPQPRTVTRAGSTYTMNTANIGRRGEDDPETEQAQDEIAWETEGDEAESVQPIPEPDLSIPEPINRPWENPLEIGQVTIWRADSRNLTGETWIVPESVDLVITSPPYNVGMEYSEHFDKMAQDQYANLLDNAFLGCFKLMRHGARIAVVVPFGVGRNPWQPQSLFVAARLQNVGFTLRGQIIWDKGNSGNRTSWGSFRLPTDPSLRDTCECIIVAHKTQSAAPVPKGLMLQDDKGSHTAWLRSSDYFMELAQDHWQVPPESAQRIGHPAPFPTELVQRLVHFYGWPGCTLLDPFAGSGTVGVVAARLQCIAHLVDIDENYCWLAAQRVAGEEQTK